MVEPCKLVVCLLETCGVLSLAQGAVYQTNNPTTNVLLILSHCIHGKRQVLFTNTISFLDNNLIIISWVGECALFFMFANCLPKAVSLSGGRLSNQRLLNGLQCSQEVSGLLCVCWFWLSIPAPWIWQYNMMMMIITYWSADQLTCWSALKMFTSYWANKNWEEGQSIDFNAIVEDLMEEKCPQNVTME